MDTIAKFWRAKTGNVAMIFALSMVPLALAAGAGLDFAHAMMVRENISDALDAAALAVGGQPNLSANAAQTLAQQVFDANYTADQSINPATHQPQDPQVAAPVITNGTVTLTLQSPFEVQTTLLSIVGTPTLPVQVSTTVKWGQTKLWVALVLDNTGSMCQPDNNPCPGDTNPNTKINTLKSASHSLMTTLQNAATNPGDVQVAIVPFAKDVKMGTSYSGASWIDWSDWNTTFPGGTPSTSVGPGSACPWSARGSAYNNCLDQPGGTLESDGVTMSTVNTIPSSGTYKGYICPGSLISSGSGQAGHYYDGCYTSTPTKTLTTTVTQSTPTTIKDSCSQVGSGAADCTQTSSSTGNTTSSTTTATTSGYSGDSGPVTTNSSSSSTSNGTQSCKTKSGTTTCTWTRTITNTAIATTITATGTGPYNHSWVINNHSVWRGCVMDRNQSDDVNDATPGTPFPAENDDSCVVAAVTPLNYNWTSLNAQIDTMVANGGTNQTIGLAHGMQMLTTGDPYDAPSLPANTSRYIILLSDGLNTMDRWYGDGTDQSTQVDARMTLACNNAKSQGFIIYTVFVDLGGTQGNSTVLQNCASDASKYYDLTTSGAIVTTFNQIGEQITNLRVSN